MKKVEIGCGPNKRIFGAIGIDILPLTGVDIVADLDKGLPFFEDNSIDEIYSHHVLEHLNDLPKFMTEVYRVLKPGGLFWGEVPHFSNPYYYSDPTHKVSFGLYTFSYFSKVENIYSRKVPAFYNDINFSIEKYKLIFKPFSKANRIRSFCFRVCQKYFNSSLYRQELFEETFSKVFSCYELQFRLRKVVL